MHGFLARKSIDLARFHFEDQDYLDRQGHAARDTSTGWHADIPGGPTHDQLSLTMHDNNTVVIVLVARAITVMLEGTPTDNSEEMPETHILDLEFSGPLSFELPIWEVKKTAQTDILVSFMNVIRHSYNAVDTFSIYFQNLTYGYDPEFLLLGDVDATAVTPQSSLLHYCGFCCYQR